jgi:hypothetical protein
MQQRTWSKFDIEFAVDLLRELHLGDEDETAVLVDRLIKGTIKWA